MCVEGSTVFCQVSAPGFFSLSCMFLDKKTLLQIGLNHGLNVIISRGTGPIQPMLDAASEGGGGVGGIIIIFVPLDQRSGNNMRSKGRRLEIAVKASCL